jgi:hypothetical protein
MWRELGVRRRVFIAAFAASALMGPCWSRAQSTIRHPRLLIAEADPFTGLGLLKGRYTVGRRPSGDMEGWALSWRLTGEESFAECALADMRTKQLTTRGKPSRAWGDYARWSLAFDWLLGYPGFDRKLQDRIAQQMDGAATMLATADFAEPSQLSYHNYALRFLALAAFASAAIEG